VAILGSATFDVATVNPLTVTLASAAVMLKGKSGNAGSFEDVKWIALYTFYGGTFLVPIKKIHFMSPDDIRTLVFHFLPRRTYHLELW